MGSRKRLTRKHPILGEWQLGGSQEPTAAPVQANTLPVAIAEQAKQKIPRKKRRNRTKGY